MKGPATLFQHHFSARHDLCGNGFSIPQYRNPVCDGEYFIQFMADKNDGSTLVFQFQNQFKQVFNLAGCQCGAWFVHDQDTGIQ